MWQAIIGVHQVQRKQWQRTLSITISQKHIPHDENILNAFKYKICPQTL